MGDLFIWKAGKKYVGKDATRVAMFLLLVSKVQTEYIVKCFTNAVEQILSVIAFYFFLEQKDKFTSKTVILTATITLSFMMRNTSPIGWIPLLALKVLKDGSFFPFLLAAITVALPVIALTVLIDTSYFLGKLDGKNWVFTSYNFLRINILEGLSEYFGSHPWSFYLTKFGPEIFTLVYPLVILACFLHVRNKFNVNQSPYLTYYCVFYVSVFSGIPHKELRFLLPIIPFAMLLAGELIAKTFKKGNNSVTMSLVLLLKIYMAYEIITYGICMSFCQRDWDYDYYLATKPSPIHSLYTQQSYTAPHYSWFHGDATKIHLAKADP